MLKKTDQEKAEKHITKGDRYIEQGKLDKAMGEYRKALKLNPDLPGIFDKLIDLRDKLGGEWDLEDFADSVSWTMEKQAQEHPAIKQVHAKLTPEWKRATELTLRILTDPADRINSDDIEELVMMGEIATRALIAVLINIKHATSPESEQPEENRDFEEEESTESPGTDDIIE